MNTSNIFIRVIVLMALSMSMLAMATTPSEIQTDTRQAKYSLPLPDGPSSIQSGLDEEASMWEGYIDVDGQGSPTWELNNVSDPSLDGKSLRCAITGGDPNSNIHCYRNLNPEPSSNFFSLSLQFQYRPTSTYNNEGDPSIVQAIEFSMSKWDQGVRYEWAMQWNNVNNSCDAGAPNWLYWNPADPCKWMDFGNSYSIDGERWHPLVLNGDILNGQVHYSYFSVDGLEQQLNIPLIAPAFESGVSDKLAVAVQLDGNSTETPYEVFIDQVTLTTWVFGDVPVSHWANDYIERLYDAGVTSGCSTSPPNYCPDATVTRAQMAIFILRGLHGSTYTPPSASGTVFGDVPTDSFAADWIEQLAAEGVTGGCGDGNYCPDATITRAQMAIFLLRGKYGSTYMPPAATGTIFSDVPIGSFAAPWIEQLARDGVTSGCGDGNYCPENSVTRAEMAVFLVRAFNLP